MTPAPPSTRRALLRAWLPAALLMAAIFALSSLSGGPLPDLDIPHGDKIAHALTYAALGALLLRALWLTSPRFATPAILLPVLLLVAGFGGLDEFHQGFVPFRSTDWLDFAADVGGGAIGATLMLAFRLLRARFTSP